MRLGINCSFFTLIIFVACAKSSETNDSGMTHSRDVTVNSFNKDMVALNTKIDDRNDSIGKGYNSITGLSLERCLENDSSQFIYDANSNVSYEANLSSEQILNKLGIGVNLKIPIEVSGIPITLSPEINYAKESSVTNLSKTAHIKIDIKKGYNQIIKKDNASGYILRDDYFKSLKKNSAEFFNICGDEIIVKQHLKAQLFVTAKFTFSDVKVKKDFETGIGVSLPNPFVFFDKKDIKPEGVKVVTPQSSVANSQNNTNSQTSATNKELQNVDTSINTPEIQANPGSATTQAEPDSSKFKTFITYIKDIFSKFVASDGAGLSAEFKAKLSLVNQQTLQNVTLTIKAIQLGGDPTKLPALVMSSCNLSDLKSCEIIFQTIQKYAAVDFPEQLNDSLNLSDNQANMKFYAGDNEKYLYANLPIFNKENQNISNEIGKYNDSSPNFTQLKINLRNDIRESFVKFLNAQDIKSSKSFNLLAHDEINLVNTTITNAENNLYALFRFVNQCYNDVIKCQMSYNNEKSTFYKEFDKNFNEIRAWQLIATSTANWQPVRYILGAFNSDRITQDFIMPSSLRGYSLLYIKFIDKDRNKITNQKYTGISLNTSFRCHNWLSDALGQVWLHEVSANSVIPITDSLINACGSKSSFACSFNSDLGKLGQFYLEVWAQ